MPGAVHEHLVPPFPAPRAVRREVVYQAGLGDLVELRELVAHRVLVGGGAREHVAQELLFLLEGEALGRDVHEIRHEAGVVLGVLECLPVGHACAPFLLPWGSRALRTVRIPVRINPNGAFPSVTKGSARLGQNPSLTCYFVTFCSGA